MPNHVQNKLTFSGDSEKVQRLIESISAKDEAGGTGRIDFEKIIPMPEGIFKGPLGSAERQQYGKNNWYDWSIEHWGTKWNAYNTDFRPQSGTLVFWTAWSAPHPVLEALAQNNPEVDIRHEWADEDLGRNCGVREYGEGTIKNEYLPTDMQKSLELALSVWDYAPQDVGLCLSRDGKHYLEWDDSSYARVTAGGKTCVFVPDILDDAETPCQYGRAYYKNTVDGPKLYRDYQPGCLGTLLSREEWDFSESGAIDLDAELDLDGQTQSLADVPDFSGPHDGRAEP
ncbi:MAG: hypothetical protein IJR83_01940 [Clostridia bacterium]|nr:hypothetical protein [Clostridia bacterium]